MQQDIQALITSCLSRLRGGWQKHVAAAKASGFWQDGVRRFTPWKHRMVDAFQRTPKLLKKRYMLLVGIILLLGVLLAAQRTASGSVTAPAPAATAEAGTVLCIGVVRDGAGAQHAFFQRAGDTLEQTLTEQGREGLVRDGFTLEHRNCYDSWQAAADWLTDGAVTLPEQATEQDFAKALLEWKQQRLVAPR
jgi:hypothetical protein